MELVIIKSKDRYIRVKEDGYHEVGIDKASVFPMDQLSLVREHKKALNRLGFTHIALKKLVLTEKDL